MQRKWLDFQIFIILLRTVFILKERLLFFFFSSQILNGFNFFEANQILIIRLDSLNFVLIVLSWKKYLLIVVSIIKSILLGSTFSRI